MSPTASSEGRAWVFGDDIDTDVLAPGLYMRGPIEELAKHCLEAIDPAFAGDVEPGDFVVAGRNFGMGSSREQAVHALVHLGVAAVIARSFAGIFYRNAFNAGLPAVICAETDEIAPGDRLKLALDSRHLEDATQGRRFAIAPTAPHLMDLIADGGLIGHLEKRLAAGKGRAVP